MVRPRLYSYQAPHLPSHHSGFTLLRGNSGVDPLAPARGILLGVCIAVAAWALGIAVWGRA
jgi:hypothetical protein